MKWEAADLSYRCGLLYQCADQLEQKVTIKFHKNKKSRYNYMRTQKETSWTCHQKKNRNQKDQNRPSTKKNTRNLTGNKTSGLFSPFLLELKNDSDCVRVRRPPHQWEWQDPRESRSPWLEIRSASFHFKNFGATYFWDWESFPLHKPYISYSLYIGEDSKKYFIRYLKCLVKFAPENMPIPRGNESYSSHRFFQVRPCC